MPNISFDPATGKMDIGDHTITGISIKNITDLVDYNITVENGRIIHRATFSGEGEMNASWEDSGKNFSMHNTNLSQTISDDPNNENGIIITIGSQENS